MGVLRGMKEGDTRGGLVQVHQERSEPAIKGWGVWGSGV